MAEPQHPWFYQLERDEEIGLGCRVIEERRRRADLPNPMRLFETWFIVTQRRPINGPCIDAEPDNASGAMIHHQQDPVRSQGYRFATKQVERPEAIPGLAQESQQTRGRCRLVPVGNGGPEFDEQRP